MLASGSAILLLMFGAHSYATDDDMGSANYFIPRCERFWAAVQQGRWDDSAGHAGAFESGLCVGRVMLLSEQSFATCTPAGVTTKQLVDVVLGLRSRLGKTLSLSWRYAGDLAAGSK